MTPESLLFFKLSFFTLAFELDDDEDDTAADAEGFLLSVSSVGSLSPYCA